MSDINENSRNSIFRNRKVASYYDEVNDAGELVCLLCPNTCRILPGELGRCGARINRDGVLYALNYGWVRVLNMEHMERLPLVEYYQGMGVVTLGTFGCNLHCPTCANFQLVEGFGTGRVLYPNEITEIALKLIDKNNIGVAYSYNEPFVWYDYLLETCKLVKSCDMQNILSTTGYVNEEPLRELLPYIDAVSYDIKSMDPVYYEEVGGKLDVVLENVKIIKEAGIHLEISTMYLPGVNDSADDFAALATFIAHELGRDVPLHILAHIPNGKTTIPQSSEDELMRMADVADNYLDSVYIGVP